MKHEQRLADLRRYFKASNKRYSVEREHLLEIIADMDGQFSIVDLFRKARSKGFIHAASTLYRNIFAFIDAGFINEIKLCGGKTVFESNLKEDNNFLLCVGCGKLVKVKSVSLGNIQKKLCSEHSFEPLNYIYQIKGYCSECQERL
ncbi:MAG: transcriptional repressor [Victivallaceae bacterium]|jgi:Fur family ferric uptake transcriptional regulator